MDDQGKLNKIAFGPWMRERMDPLALGKEEYEFFCFVNFSSDFRYESWQAMCSSVSQFNGRSWVMWNLSTLYFEICNYIYCWQPFIYVREKGKSNKIDYQAIFFFPKLMREGIVFFQTSHSLRVKQYILIQLNRDTGSVSWYTIL